ncbi:DUF2723 domain-containing protein [Prevotella communis]|uniref:glycosyltransferase family 117 protein n=1 Tax=Prevotella communis TaxID=2913614 RepID=UPI001EDA06A5|nr:DUF2723 domain-containing protein [Prevotella communis]UKK59487.1 DUF2723 domain-containing protein [Prevotella communis]
MQQETFKKLNSCMAWLVFAIAAIVYGLTVEPTASLWDCPEFIACGYKLEIGHPPGAPVFMLAANLFSQLASDPSQVALMVNLLSALLSAGCIFFLFLTVTHLSEKLIVKSERQRVGDGTSGMKFATATPSLSQVITIEACGMVGALAYTFSDTFWFSAVEAEVYAFSSFLTALMFWLILKWESEMDKPGSTRWIVLIAYITGLSIGVHLLCLLCLPAMSLVVYFRRTKRVTWMGMLKALIAGGLLVAVILFGLIPGVVKFGGWFELLFTNVLGCPYNTGLICYILLLTGTIVIAYYKVKRRTVRLSLACLLMMLIGYSSYGVIIIRANAQTPMCENAPDNIFSLGSYLNREQYGKTPLFYGPAYCSEIDRVVKGEYLVPRQKEGQAVYRPVADSTKREYEVVRHDIEYLYKNNMYFPRMHSSRHTKAYEDWKGYGSATERRELGGVEKKNGVPTAAENLRFFLSYQVNFMYWRYFLWNFVGRQNNIQGHGEVEHGNWITGFRWIDDWLLGCDTSKLPSDLKENKGRNVFYGLPLLLGLVGMLWQWRKGSKGKQQFLVVMLLFLMTGLAIVVYLNQTPLQPRERDYAYAGSFYAFAIWIGLGVGMISEKVRVKSAKYATALAILSAITCLLVPLQMASQTWDDHDRSGRYTCRDFGANYLNSMQREGHPIILTNGDNDTFPLWYNHEVEGVRTDTRVVNMEYLQTDWYIDQMKRQAYDSPPLPISLSHEDYKEGRMEYVPIDTDSITIGPATISLKGKQGLFKNELMVLDMLLQANWERPVYMSISMGSDILPFLRDHLVLEGLAYRISPTATTRRIDVERLYDNIMHRFRYGGLSTKGIYVDEDVKRMANTHQLIMGVLIDSLLHRGDLKRALNVCHKWQKEMPQENVPYTEYALSMARCYYMARQPEQGDEIVSDLLRRSDEWLFWINTIKSSRRAGSLYNRYTWMQTMEQALVVAEQYERSKFIHQYIKQYEHYNKQYQ